MKFHNITKCDMLNGDGLRVVLWVSGCELQCEYCQNKITWDPNYGVEFDKDAENELFEALNKDYISGITFSGGHPLHPQNIQTITNIIKKVKEELPEKTIWLYTGYTLENILDILDLNNTKYVESLTVNIDEYLTDLCYILHNIDILVDGPYIHKLRNTQLKWRGSSNQRVINMKKTLYNIRVLIKELRDNYTNRELQNCIVLHCD